MHFIEWHYIATFPSINFNIHLVFFTVLRLCYPCWSDMLTLLIGIQSGDLYSLEAVAFHLWQLFFGYEVWCGVLCSLCTLVIALQRLLRLDGCSLVPLTCVRMSCCFCIVNQGAPSCNIYHT